MDESNKKLAATVIRHMRQCEHCFKKINAFQNIYLQLLNSDRNDELVKLTEEFLNGEDVDKNQGIEQIPELMTEQIPELKLEFDIK
jgi:hypothetical protein